MSALLTPPKPVAGPPRRARFTRAQYYDMGNRGYFQGKRVERIRGEIIEMSPVNWPHVLTKQKTVEALRVAFGGIGWVSEQSPVTLPVTDSDPEPDVAVYPGSVTDYTDHPTSAQALLVVEVSDSSLYFDTTTKVELYAEDGVREYWVADVNAPQLLVFRDPGPIAAGGHTYHTRLTLTAADTVSPLAAPTHTLRVADLLP